MKKLEAKERFRIQRAKKGHRRPSAAYTRKMDIIRIAQMYTLMECDMLLSPSLSESSTSLLEVYDFIPDYNVDNGHTLAEVNFISPSPELSPRSSVEVKQESLDSTGMVLESVEKVIDVEESIKRWMKI